LGLQKSKRRQEKEKVEERKGKSEADEGANPRQNK
jgi:hypothetical protein